jgi:octaprenyl-diphosphate synthase
MDRNNDLLKKHRVYFEKIDEELYRVLNSRVALIKDIGKHALFGQSKRLRPLCFVLSSQLCNYQGEDLYRLSTVFEYVHTASLLHDDVLDNSEIRRNKSSANHLWGNHAAILEGDFLCSRSFSIALGSKNLRFLERIADTSMIMTEGQVMELSHANDWNTSKEKYMEIITAKTAALMSAACACGAIVSGAEANLEAALSKFGLNMGIGFQLMDDLLDYTSSEEVFGKPVGKDLREGKITLPLIYTTERLEVSEKTRLENLFKNRRAAEEDYLSLIEFVRGNGALDQIRDEAQSYVDRAANCLDPFPDSPTKESLLELNQYIVDRKY